MRLRTWLVRWLGLIRMGWAPHTLHRSQDQRHDAVADQRDAEEAEKDGKEAGEEGIEDGGEDEQPEEEEEHRCAGEEPPATVIVAQKSDARSATRIQMSMMKSAPTSQSAIRTNAIAQRICEPSSAPLPRSAFLMIAPALRVVGTRVPFSMPEG